MAENSNVQAITVANTRFRRFADQGARLCLYSGSLRTLIAASDIGALFQGGADDVLADGSAEDGRSRLTNTDLKNLIAGVDRFLAFFEQNPDLRDLMLRAAVNPEQL